MKRTQATNAVLGALWIDGEQHGYEISKATGLATGTVYPILHRLLDEGLVAGSWETMKADERGRPPRRKFRLTEKGKELISGWLS